ncbi:MAG: 1-acyl-sn-glycerol-3-phosphate acyltransferase [Bacteroidota bacterium]
MKKIYQFIFFRLMGWRITGFMNPTIKKSVIIVVPHTSWVDFITGVLVRGCMGMQINFVAKKELFRFPFGAYFKWMGGAPLNRQKSDNKVDAIAGIFNDREIFRLGIAPEGTRKKVDRWKTGFYYIALKADVPVIAIAFDYGNKEVKVSDPYCLTGNIESDFAVLESNYTGVEGYVPQYSYKN